MPRVILLIVSFAAMGRIMQSHKGCYLLMTACTWRNTVVFGPVNHFVATLLLLCWLESTYKCGWLEECRRFRPQDTRITHETNTSYTHRNFRQKMESVG